MNKTLRMALTIGLLLAGLDARATSDQNATDAVSSLKAYALFKSGDYAAAREIWQRLAERGNTTALINLANLFQQGKGVTEDQRQALDYVRQAAQLGDSRAQYELAIEYEKGVLLARDLDQAELWLKRAAEQDNEDAQYAYGILLATARGQGLEQASPELRRQAVDWLTRAKNNGHPDAASYIRLLSPTLEKPSTRSPQP
jgi:TPR repeat protein